MFGVCLACFNYTDESGSRRLLLSTRAHQIKICFILICLLTGTAWELPTVLGYAKLWAKCSQIDMSSVWKATSVK